MSTVYKLSQKNTAAGLFSREFLMFVLEDLIEPILEEMDFKSDNIPGLDQFM